MCTVVCSNVPFTASYFLSIYFLRCEYVTRGQPYRISTPWGREGITNNADKSGQGEEGGLAVSGHHFLCGLCK